MESYTLGTFFTGFLIFVAGALIIIFYRPISDNLVRGASSYDKVRLAGLIGIGLGLFVMTGLHILILNALVKALVPGT